MEKSERAAGDLRVMRSARRTILAFLAGITAFLPASCGRKDAHPSGYITDEDDQWDYYGVQDADIQARYDQSNWEDAGPTLDFVRMKLPYDSITLERHGCTGGFCPDFRLTVNKFGFASFAGRWLVPMEGDWIGELSLPAFARICHALDLLLAKRDLTDPSRLNDREGGFSISVWPNGSSNPVLLEGDYGDGPTEYWVLRSAIEGLTLQVQWSQVPTS